MSEHAPIKVSRATQAADVRAIALSFIATSLVDDGRIGLVDARGRARGYSGKSSDG
jgi:hypothetical protein